MSMKRGGVPKMGDVSHVGATSKSYQPEKVPRGGRSSGSVGGDAVPPMLPQTQINNDIEDKEEMRMRELEEARARAAQMEKTMRWWSDCTANWREKWGKVRAERNKSRDECRQLRMKVETTVKECAALKREKEELIRENEKLCKELHNVQQSEKEQASSISSEGSTACNKQSLNIPERDTDPILLNEASAAPDNELFLQGISKTEKVTKNVNQDKIQLPSPDEELAEQKVLMIEMKLEEATKTIQVERDSKEVLHKEIEKLQSELTSLKNRQEEMRKCKDETLKELSLLKQEHDIALGRITSDLEDETSTRSNMDRRLADMRKQLERLQAENAAEWGKRERLETEKLALERENKKLKALLEDLEENLLKKNKLATAAMDSDFKQNQAELFEKTKEVADLRHNQIKLKKILQDKTAELGHAQRQAEQHESEVKKLRTRIEELKKDFARSEDEVN
ncbi:coiled-coil domain-containing protein 102A-like [Saccoglossus kowalevskii]|uniref:Coiled-coil domain-containing protein 102A-like n=1 Tax=Saccoglossus kowalevskii TaxID=10224 RepID=A0ABM0MX92_SACKO|nr:PREDICTED: coiled-coil domain-containing protein 102A-like [Saccoglossus kowalevskii]